ncbi:hypothetical protein ABKN59_010046 [Abortiporus biennis]
MHIRTCCCDYTPAYIATLRVRVHGGLVLGGAGCFISVQVCSSLQTVLTWFHYGGRFWKDGAVCRYWFITCNL